MKLSMGIDLGGTKIKAGIINSSGELLVSQEYTTPLEGGDEIVDTIRALKREFEADFEISAVGLGTPGRVQAQTGTIIGCTPNLKNWLGRPLKSELMQLLKCPVEVGNDAKMATYGEWKCGAGKNTNHMIMLTLGTGLGSGHIYQNQLMEGSHGLGIGYGHQIVAAKGRWCNCGQQGCLESYVSGKGIVKTYTLLGGHTQIKSEDIFAMAAAGEAYAQKTLELTIFYLAVGISNIFNTLAPEKIILGGGISRQGEKNILFPLREQVKGIMSMNFDAPDALQLAHLGADSGLIGAGLRALHLSP